MQINNTSAMAASLAQSQSTTSLVSQNTVYSASVAGKTYSADISLSAGEYVATVPDLPGVSATGSTLIEAENNLGTSIDLQV
jgi:hypothetical protein